MTEILNRTDRDIAAAAKLLAAGELVAFGTETVYGLGADAHAPTAVAKIFEAKGRPHFNPLIIHYLAPEDAWADVYATPAAERLADTFWPGPLTLILPRRVTAKVALLAGAGLDTLAVRVPAHAVASRLLAAFGRPIAAPSANRSGAISPTSVAHVLNDLQGRIAAVIDSGACRVGLESTVLDLSTGTPFLLRPGGVNLEAIQAALGQTKIQVGIPLARAAANQTLRSPGLLHSHYAPTLPVRLNVAGIPHGAEALLAFGAPLPGFALTNQLSESGNLNEAAANLFEALHALDAAGPGLGISGIAVMPIPNHGLGLAINDRLERAAAPRSAVG
jgi:L-threonylcarbamoyladenylate synthase